MIKHILVTKKTVDLRKDNRNFIVDMFYKIKQDTQTKIDFLTKVVAMNIMMNHFSQETPGVLRTSTE